MKTGRTQSTRLKTALQIMLQKRNTLFFSHPDSLHLITFPIFLDTRWPNLGFETCLMHFSHPTAVAGKQDIRIFSNFPQSY
jgi:hypothetical protein